MQSVNQSLDPQNKPNISAERATYGVPFMTICKQTDRVITAPQCISLLKQPGPFLLTWTNLNPSMDT